MNKITRVVPWYGSKASLTDWIIPFFPEHKVYVEPFGGGANVLLNKKPCEFEVYNDLDSNLVNFFRVLRNNSDELIRLIELTPYSREEYLNAFEPTDCPIEATRRFYVRCWQGRGGKGKSNQQGGWFCMSTCVGGKGGNNMTKWNNINNVRNVTLRIRNTYLEHDDAFKIIPRFDSKDTLFYIDPPYCSDKLSRKYNHQLSQDDQVKLAELLHNVQGYVVLSGFDSDLYQELYGDWHKETKEVLTRRKGKRTECLWLSPNIAPPAKQLPMF